MQKSIKLFAKITLSASQKIGKLHQNAASSTKKLFFNQLDQYGSYMELNKIPALICARHQIERLEINVKPQSHLILSIALQQPFNTIVLVNKEDL